MANHLENEPTLIGGLVTLSIYSAGLQAIQQVRDNAVHDVHLLREISIVLRDMPMSKTAFRIDGPERMSIVNLLEVIVDNDPKTVVTLLGMDQLPITIVRLFHHTSFNKEQAINAVNEMMDQCVAAARIVNPLQSIKAFEQVQSNSMEYFVPIPQIAEGEFHDVFTMPQPQQSQVLTKGLSDYFIGAFGLKLGNHATIEHQARSFWEAQTLATAVARYRIAHGQPPAVLNQLVPRAIHVISLH